MRGQAELPSAGLLPKGTEATARSLETPSGFPAGMAEPRNLSLPPLPLQVWVSREVEQKQQATLNLSTVDGMQASQLGSHVAAPSFVILNMYPCFFISIYATHSLGSL